MLRINLLPRHFAVARRNKLLSVVMLVLVLVALASWLFYLNTLAGIKKHWEDEIAAIKPQADLADQLTAQIAFEKGRIAPIQDQIRFITTADNCGGQFFDRFYLINEFISDQAQLSSFTITPPGSVSFTATLPNSGALKRFMLNLMRCPYLTGISMSGNMLGGGGGAAIGGGGGRGMGGGPPGMGGGPPGMGGGPPGMGGFGGGATSPAPVVSAAPAAPGGAPITVTVSAALVSPVSIPGPPAPAAARPAAPPAAAPAPKPAAASADDGAQPAAADNQDETGGKGIKGRNKNIEADTSGE